MLNMDIRKRIISDDTPVRDWFSDSVDNIPTGPLGKVGGGNIIGAGGYVVSNLIKIPADLVPGIRNPGYTFISHGVEGIDEHTERHVIRVHAFSEDVAKFAVKYFSSPSNVDFITGETELEYSKKINSRKTYSTYEVSVIVLDRGTVEGDIVEEVRQDSMLELVKER
jgi:hypothetical protein